ncbi:hypothetical protein CISIN_1g047074mg [Citrus sinensis]|uniref:Uncharacterized protein n=1 Tax=Citrus sinensis TaxID=2711 RepID=A0A067EST6_CITSI|nr:hypothetical protein CISIN_1g047074mg [Citrus sinensis]
MAVATSLEHLTPRPTWPSVSPTTTKALNLVLQFVVDKRVDDLILLDWDAATVTWASTVAAATTAECTTLAHFLTIWMLGIFQIWEA